MRSRCEDEISESSIRALWSAVISQAMLDLACTASIHNAAHRKVRWDCANFLFGRLHNLQDVLDAAGANYSSYAGMMNEVLRTAKEVIELWRKEGRDRSKSVIWKREGSRREMSRLGVRTAIPRWFSAGEAMILNLAQAMWERGEDIQPLPWASAYKPPSRPPMTTKNGHILLTDRSELQGRRPIASEQQPTTTRRPRGRQRNTSAIL